MTAIAVTQVVFPSPAQKSVTFPDLLKLRVRSVVYQTADINAYELVHPSGCELPPFTAGSHIDVHLDDGRVRQYSLCNSPTEESRYMIAVLNQPHGRGGSKAIHERLHAGSLLSVSAPRNNFALNEKAESYLLMAGGIGITPILSMIYRLRDIGADFKLHFCTRTLERTPFSSEIVGLVEPGRLFIHHDEGNPRNGLDIANLLETEKAAGRHIYCCGPAAFIDAVQSQAHHWPSENIHFERFAAPSTSADTHEECLDVFQVRLEQSGQIIDVPQDMSIVQALRAHGIDVPTSCEAGLCGTCRTRYLSGTPDHRDYLLSQEEREHEMLICCSRSRTPLLTLDL